MTKDWEKKCEVLKVYKEWRISEKSMKVLRVVRWNKGKPKLELRHFYATPVHDPIWPKASEWKTGKLCAMDFEVLTFCVQEMILDEAMIVIEHAAPVGEKGGN